jgi:copper(I)-binding protein
MLVLASTSAAARSSLHESRTVAGVMEMRSVDGGLPLPAGHAVVLGPVGLHIMMEGLGAPSKAGTTVRMHLTFARSSIVDVDAPVLPIAATGAGPHPDADLGGMDMGH